MESYLNENFDLMSRNPKDEPLQRWRKLCGVVKKPKRRFRFTANLSKRMEAQAMQRTYQRCRDRNNEKMKALQELIPRCNKSDTASLLVEANEYIKSLQLQVQVMKRLQNLMKLKDEEGEEEGGGEKKDEGGGDKGGGGKGGGGGSEKKDKEGGGRAGEKKDKTSGELRKMGANNVYGGWFMCGPGTCAEAVLDEPKQEEWLLTGFAFIVSVCHSIYIAAGVGTVTIHLCEWANRFSPSLVVDWF